MKNYEKCEKIKTLNLSQGKEETISCQNRLSYYKVFHRKSTSNENEKPHILMIKTVYLGLSILELGKASI